MAPHKLRGSGALSGWGRGGAHTAGGVPGGVGIVSCNIIIYIKHFVHFVCPRRTNISHTQESGNFEGPVGRFNYSEQ